MSEKKRKIEESAAAWFGRRDGGLSPEEEAEFQAWLGSDLRHEAAFRRLIAVSWKLDGLACLRTGPEPQLAVTSSRRLRGAAILAVAASLMLAGAFFWHGNLSASPYSRTAASALGEIRKIALPDGSSIDLNTDSAVEIRFTASERRARLVRGEANFAVAKNPRRPFIVEADGVSVRAVGTAFDVRLGSGAIEVLVTEGRVRVDDAKRGESLISTEAPPPMKALESQPLLAAGHRAVIRIASGSGEPFPSVPSNVEIGAIAQALAWRDGRLAFDPTPLREVIAEFNRYNRHKLILGDGTVAELRVGGTFNPTDYEAFVRLLESSFGVKAERLPEETVLRTKP